jgi:hypothetical protein
MTARFLRPNEHADVELAILEFFRGSSSMTGKLIQGIDNSS